MAGSPASCPLFARALKEIKSADDLVTWGNCAFGCRRVVGLRELRVAALLFACSGEGNECLASPEQQGFLGAHFEEEVLVMGMGGPLGEIMTKAHASLLDLSLRFGHAEIARCLHGHGLSQRALRQEDLQVLPATSLAGVPLWTRFKTREGGMERMQLRLDEWQWAEDRLEWEQRSWSRFPDEDWQQWVMQERPLCPWQEGLREDMRAASHQHIWSDWTAPTACAQLLVDAPATRAALVLAAEGTFVDLEEGAELRLLDAAVLLGEPRAAAAVAGLCGGSQRPGRFWGELSLHCWPQHVEAHLRAGLRTAQALGFESAADMADMAVERGHAGLAQAVSEILPEEEPEEPVVVAAGDFLKADASGTAVIRPECLDALAAAGVSKPGCFVITRLDGSLVRRKVPVLFLAVSVGDEPAARRLLRLGFTLEGLDRECSSILAHANAISREIQPSLPIKPVDRRLEVARDTSRRLFASALLRSRSALLATRRRGFCRLGESPPGLLERIAGFAAEQTEAEKGFRQELTRMTGKDPLGNLICQALAGGQRAEPGQATGDVPMQTPPAALLGQQPSEQLAQTFAGSSALPPREPPAGLALEAAGAEQEDDKDLALEAEELSLAVQQSESEAVQAEQEDVQMAVLLSKQEALNLEVYALLRLTRHKPEVVDCLLTSAELLPCRERVAAAGCEVQPAWAGGAVLLVPMTQDLYQSELCLQLKGHHVLMLESDVDLLLAALSHVPCRRRPQVRREHRADWHEGTAEGLARAEVPLSEEGPGEGSPAGGEEEAEQPGSEAAQISSAEEAIFMPGNDLAARLAAAQVELLRSHGIVVQNTFWGGPDNHFGLSAARSAHSAPAGVSL